MAPAKRKRADRQPSEDEGSSRPSPYKPGEKSSAAPAASTSRRTSRGKAVDAEDEEMANSAADTPASEAAANANGNGSIDEKPRHRYVHITDDVVTSWTDSTPQTILDAAAGSDDMAINDVLLELVRSALDGRLTGEQAGLVVRDLIAAQEDVDVTFIFINTISFLYEANHKGPGLAEMIAASRIDHQRLRQELDIPMLQDLDLVRSTFERVRTRKTTNALYRQANFNLLREESEGYAKLITEYFNTAQEASSRRDEDPYMAEDAFQRVKALVGAFDLDVGRVLDITLDVSANLLVKAYPFFMKFYRASSWWPDNEQLDNIRWEDQGFSSLPNWALPRSGRSTSSEEEKEQMLSMREARDVVFWQRVQDVGMNAFFELGTRKIVDFDAILHLLETEAKPELDSRGKESNSNKRQRLNEDRKYMRETKCLPPSGNYDAAQLLGFKLRFYASDARDASDSLPDNVIFLAALLIKIGFISLRDLYPHLHPSDEDMKAEKTRLEKEKADKDAKDRPGGGMNALLMAGALVDDLAPPTRGSRIDKEKSGGATPAQEKKDEAKEELPTPANQKLLLLRALLLIGAIPEALYILGRFPWLADVDISLPPFLLRIAKQMLSKVAASLKPLDGRTGLSESKDQLVDTTPRPDGTLPFTTRPAKKVTRWLHNDCFDKDDGLEYKHYYGDWSENVPICQNLDDVFALCGSFLGFLGVKIGQDVELYSTLLRLAHKSMSEDTSSSNHARWLDLMKRLLVPALSCTKHNPQLAQQVFDLLRFFPTSTRYNVYAEWFTSRKITALPEMKVALARNLAEVKDVLRRVSNDTGKKQSRALGKVSLASPGVVMAEMISQLENYSNMIPALVECTRYFSSLAYDVLTWSLINSLRGAGRSRIQADGMLTSPWLQALSQFVAALFTRYTHLNPSPLLQYLASELRVGNSTDLEMFEQMLAEMAGIRSDVEFNDSQVIAMAGGDMLQSHIMQQLSDTRHVKKASAKRLIKALSEPGLIGQCLIAIAQERQMYQHRTNETQLSIPNATTMPLKVLGNNVDKIQAVFAQYLDVLRNNLKPEEFEACVPNAVSLIQDFGLEPGAALTICRVALRGRMDDIDRTRKQEERNEKSQKIAQDLVDAGGDAAMKDVAENVIAEASATTPPAEQDTNGITLDEPSTSSPWHPVLEPVIEGLSNALPDLSARVSIPFYVSFWTLASGDVHVPIDSYNHEVARLEHQIKEIMNDRSDVSAIASRERDRKRKGLQEWYDKLKGEPAQQLAAFIEIRKRISKGENLHWFSNNPRETKAEKEAKYIGLLQECFIPRAILSSVDAHFSFLMLKLMHDNATPGFSLMHLIHQLFKKNELAALLFQCTANEAQHLARFLSETLKMLHRWHADKATYEKEALGDKTKLRGFVITFEENGEPKTVLDFENFRRVLFNYHTYINGALLACFQSGEYMHIRNGIIALKGIHQVFPAIKFMGTGLFQNVKKISAEDTRSDLKLAAMSLLGPLKSRDKHWVLPQAFRLNDPKDAAKPGSRPASAQPETDSAEAKLSASAPEFKPSTSRQSNGRKESTVGGREDGEIDDAKDGDTEMRDAPAKDVKKEEEKPTLSNSARINGRSESKPSTPAPGRSRPPPSAGVPPRPESSRNSSTPQGNSRGPPSSLPSRPEAGPPQPPLSASGRGGRGLPGRPDDRSDGRSDDRFGRLERPGDGRPGSRDQSPPGHRSRGRTPPGAGSRSGSYRDERPFDRPSDRPGPDSRGGRDDGWPGSRRDAPPQHSRPHADPRDRHEHSGRSAEALHPDRMGHVSAVARSEHSNASPRTSSRAPLPPQAPPAVAHGVNPERLALINKDSPNSSSPRGGRDGEKDQRREREPRSELVGPPAFPSRSDSRQNGRGSVDVPRDALPRSEIQQDKRGGRVNSREMGPPQAESNYGRLNPSDPPSGPRQPNGSSRGGGRNFTAPSGPRANDVPLPSPNPRGPQSSAPSRGGLSRQPSERNAGPPSAPSTPVLENGPAVHPSRAAQLGQTSQPSPIQTNFPAPNAPRNLSSPTSAAPSGPRGSARTGPPSGTPTGPAPGPPSGPAGRGGATPASRQRSAIDTAMKSSGPAGQGVNFRGAARQSSAAGPSNGPQAPSAIASAPDGPPSRPHFDAPAGNSRPDLFGGKPDESGHRRRDDDRQHSSRNPSRERRSGPGDAQFGRPPAVPPPPPGQPPGAPDRRGPRDDRRPHDERSSRDGGQHRPNDRRSLGNERQQRPDEPPARRPLPDPQPVWEQSRGNGGPPRDGFRGGGQGPPRREDDRRESRGPPRDDANQGPHGRKRPRNEDPPFEGNGAKRRQSGRT